MKFYQTPYLRPLLNFSREEIKKYAQTCKINFLEDPSNKDNFYLRNWIRNKWLKDLEKKRSGSVKSLSRSLELLADTSNSNSRIHNHSRDLLEVFWNLDSCFRRNDGRERNDETGRKNDHTVIPVKTEISHQEIPDSTIHEPSGKLFFTEAGMTTKLGIKGEEKKTGRTELILTAKGIDRKLFMELSLEDQKKSSSLLYETNSTLELRTIPYSRTSQA